MSCGQLPYGGCWLPITHEGKCINPEVAKRVLEAVADIDTEVYEYGVTLPAKKFMRVTVQLTETSQPIEIEDAVNTYTKGPLYCVYRDGGIVQKFPVGSLWRITETY